MTLERTTLHTHHDLVDAEIDCGVGIVRINRPPCRDTVHTDAYESAAEMLECFANDSAVVCVMIAGIEFTSCTGESESGAGIFGMLEPAARIVRLIHEMPQVTIAALSKPTVGIGMSIALSTDLRIAGRSACLIPEWDGLGYRGDVGGAWLLTRLVGPSRAMQIMLDGNPVKHDVALRLGLFNMVVEDAHLPQAAVRWARVVASATAPTRIKAKVAEALTIPLQQTLPLDSEQTAKAQLIGAQRRVARAWMEALAERPVCEEL
jgi:2-(1,2-epoxy-1,2-dihydrophenyl)acetyl-CoA isomerase